jgi:hypothetical protein
MIVARRLMCSVFGALLLAMGVTSAARADAPSPQPATGGTGVPLVFAHTTFDLGQVGYTQQEFFLSGMATAYAPTSALTSDGKWSVTETTEAPYKTRIVVDRPVSARHFNGTVLVEWLNVTGGADASPDWVHGHDELIREGYAWVGVSAQAVGLNALKLPLCPPGPPTAPCGDPDRYGTLMHPGDSYSYDIFSQAGAAVREHADIVLGGLQPQRVLGAGESQSAGRLVTYIDAVHPVAHAYDGFLVHSRGGGGAPLSQAPEATMVTPPTPTFIRDDIDVPVLQFETETDLVQLGFVAARQPDSAHVATWEVAGTAHFDQYGLVLGWTDTGTRQTDADWFATMQNPPNSPSPNFTCDIPINTGPQTYVIRAAIDALDRWVTDGTHPPTSPRLQTTNTSPPQVVVDADGIAVGGIRTPAVDAPVAKLSGFGQTGGTQFCNIFGTTVPFSQQRLAERYHRHSGFVLAWDLATIKSFRAGFLEPEDALDLLVVGARSNVLR